jgi:hypothetical protein
MRIFKLVTTLLVLGLIGAFIYQNTPTFQTPIPFRYNLLIQEEMQWTHHLYTLLLVSAFGGVVFGILIMMKPYFNVRRLLAQERQEKQAMAPTPPPPSHEAEGEAKGAKEEA